MSDCLREYLEFKVFIIGEENVGKRSFINKVLNLPSDATIRPENDETYYKKDKSKLTQFDFYSEKNKYNKTEENNRQRYKTQNNFYNSSINNNNNKFIHKEF